MPIPHRGQLIPFRAVAIDSFDEFNALCPLPSAPGRLTKAGYEKNFDDPSYKEMLAQYTARKVSWMVITSLKDIQWDTVDASSPGTWLNWEADLKKNGFSEIVIQRIAAHVMDVNALDESKLEAARNSFAHGQGLADAASSSLTIEQPTTPSGEPVAE
jgi:hypothetical protein